MTWEDIYNKLCQFAIIDGSPLAHNIKIVIEGELHNKVIVGKGENRHPYADVLHAWVEGAIIYANYTGEMDFRWAVALPSKDFEYHIKPSEPAYVYQYAYLEQGSDTTWEMSGYMTDDEFKNCGLSHADFQVKKCEWTRKERKND